MLSRKSPTGGVVGATPDLGDGEGGKAMEHGTPLATSALDRSAPMQNNLTGPSPSQLPPSSSDVRRSVLDAQSSSNGVRPGALGEHRRDSGSPRGADSGMISRRISEGRLEGGTAAVVGTPNSQDGS